MIPEKKDQGEEWGGLEDHHVTVDVPPLEDEPQEVDPDVVIAMRELAAARKRVNKRRGEER